MTIAVIRAGATSCPSGLCEWQGGAVNPVLSDLIRDLRHVDLSLTVMITLEVDRRVANLRALNWQFGNLAIGKGGPNYGQES